VVVAGGAHRYGKGLAIVLNAMKQDDFERLLYGQFVKALPGIVAPELQNGRLENRRHG
jgi:hypothetical protein